MVFFDQKKLKSQKSRFTYLQEEKLDKKAITIILFDYNLEETIDTNRKANLDLYRMNFE